MNGSWDAYLSSPADFAGADDIIINLTKEREPGDIERTPYFFIIAIVPAFILGQFMIVSGNTRTMNSTFFATLLRVVMGVVGPHLDFIAL